MYVLFDHLHVFVPLGFSSYASVMRKMCYPLLFIADSNSLLALEVPSLQEILRNVVLEILLNVLLKGFTFVTTSLTLKI